MEKPKLFEAAENRNRFLETAKEYQRQLGLKTQDWIVAKNLACLEFHCEAFCISDKLRHSRALAGFASLVRTTEYGSVEVSVKVEDGVAQAARFNLFCHPFDKAGFTSTILTFFDDVARSEEVHLDTGHIKELLDGGVDFGRVSRMVCGIDLRAERRLSRLKLWFFADNEPGRTGNPVEHALTMRGAGPLFRTLHLHPGLLFGYDLRFDGTTALKLYPDITGDEFASLAIRSRLSAVLAEHSTRSPVERCVPSRGQSNAARQRGRGPVIADPDRPIGYFQPRHAQTRNGANVEAVNASDIVDLLLERHPGNNGIDLFLDFRGTQRGRLSHQSLSQKSNENHN